MMKGIKRHTLPVIEENKSWRHNIQHREQVNDIATTLNGDRKAAKVTTVVIW